MQIAVRHWTTSGGKRDDPDHPGHDEIDIAVIGVSRETMH
jgi:hypothetical protein